MSVEKMRAYRGPVLLSQGFRPFFLLGALQSAVAILIWLGWLLGWLEPRTAFAPVDWHVHEMLFGFLPAIVTGFLLTAVPNWTGRLPVRGAPLGGLVGLWLAGRLAIGWSAVIGPMAATTIDCLYLAVLAAVIANEIVSGRNWRNLKVLLPLTILLAANLLFHWQASGNGSTDIARRLALSAVLALIMLIGGRIVPSFTRNWLARENPGRLPVPFARLDMLIMGLSLAALAVWSFPPEGLAAGVLMVLAALANGLRLARWAGDRTTREPLVLVLHLSFAFIPMGFGLAGLSALRPDLVPTAAGLHAFGVGAVGAMTLSVMIRSSLGHTGHALAMNRPAQLVFALVVAATFFRLAAVFDPDRFTLWIAAAGLAWAAAFLGFCAVIGPKLLRRRLF